MKKRSPPLSKKLEQHITRLPLTRFSFWIGLLLGCLAGWHLGQEFAPHQTPAPFELTKPNVKVGFSPEGSASKIIEELIDRAQTSIHLAAYTYASQVVTDALLRAKDRGVTVKLVIDYRAHFQKDGKLNFWAIKALRPLLEAGVPVRVNKRYTIHHDKFLIVDLQHVETGSFNFSRAAAHANSENCLILYAVPHIAGAYFAHWESRYEQGIPLSLIDCI